jgi:hypothetical protein
MWRWLQSLVECVAWALVECAALARPVDFFANWTAALLAILKWLAADGDATVFFKQMAREARAASGSLDFKVRRDY